MALTQDSFRDPRRLYRVKVKSPFFVTGRKDPTEVGDIIALPRSEAAEVIHSNKAVSVEEGTAAPSSSPIMRADPPDLNEMTRNINQATAELPPEPPKDAKASKSKGD